MTCLIRDLWTAYAFGAVTSLFVCIAAVVVWADIAWARSGGKVK